MTDYFYQHPAIFSKRPDADFWAARGKRGLILKPNGLFGAISRKRYYITFFLFGGFNFCVGFIKFFIRSRRSFKPNGYFAVDVKNKEEGPEFWAIRG